MSYTCERNAGLTASARWVISSFLSLAFFKPAKAILVPGMYWGNVSCVPSFRYELAHLLWVLEVLESRSQYADRSIKPLAGHRDIPRTGCRCPEQQSQHTFADTCHHSTHPCNALVDVGGGVREALDLTGLSAKQTVEVRSDLVWLSGTEGVALSASGLHKEVS